MLHKPAKLHPPQTTFPAMLQPPQCSLHHACQAPQRLHLTLQCPMASCPGMATLTLAGLCVLWLPSTASSSGNHHKPAKPQPPQTTTCLALPQPPAQGPPHLVHNAESVFDLAVPHGMPRAGHSHTGRALCAVVAECCLLLWNSPPQTGKTATPENHPPGPAAAPNAGPFMPTSHCRGCI